MGLNMFKISAVLERGIVPIQVLHPPAVSGSVLTYDGDMEDYNATKGRSAYLLIDGGISITNVSYITFKVTNIDRVETNLLAVSSETYMIWKRGTHHGYPKPHIAFCKLISNNIFLISSQNCFNFV